MSSGFILAVGFTLSFVGVVAALSGSGSGQQLSGQTLQAIEAYFKAEVERAGFPGGSLAIVQGKDIVLVSSVGVSDLEAKTPVTPDTVFCIGSITKSFTATALLQLRDRGLVDLAAPVTRYLPWFRVADEGAAEKISLQQLLTHTSGIPTNSHSVLWSDPPSIRNSIDRAVRALRWTELSSPPGARFEYANMNYVVLGRVIEAVTGISWAQYIDTNIFAQVGMKKSTSSLSAVGPRTLARSYWPEFGRLAEEPLQMGDFIAPASNILTTAPDLAAYAAAQLGTGAVLLSSETLTEAHSKGVKKAPGQRYAYGWINEQFQGVTVVHHGGAAGHAAGIYLIPERQLGIVVLLGAYSHIQNDRIAEGVVSLALGKLPPPIEGPSELWVLLWVTRGFVGLTLACPLTLAILPIVRRLRWRFRGRRIKFVRAGSLVVGAAGVWVLVFRVIPSQVPELPLPLGFHGWFTDLAVVAGMVVLTATAWAVWGIATAVWPRKAIR